MTIKWRRGAVPYFTSGPDGKPVTELRPGLIAGNLAIVDACGYCLTHIPSGLQVGSFSRLRAARAAGATLRSEFGALGFLDRAAAAQLGYPGEPAQPDDDDTQQRFRKRFYVLQRQLDRPVPRTPSPQARP